MTQDTRSYILNNIKLPINASFKEAFSVAKEKLKRLGIKNGSAEMRIFRRSTDARDKNNIIFVYSVLITDTFSENESEKLIKNGFILLEAATLDTEIGNEQLKARPVIIGSGPCGIFAGLMLAEKGYRPIIIERGSSVKERQAAVLKFKEEGILDLNTNIQFGAGGAGTFSDGKLITRINDKASSYVMQKFVDFGAPSEILYLARPHIGTDVLSSVVDRMLKKIEELGGEVIYNTTYLDSYSLNGKSYVKTTKGDFPAGAIILAIGHSARDTYDTMISRGYNIEAKPISVGMRIEHLREKIDEAMWGKFAGHSALGSAEYNLSYDTKNRGVYTFCMCPGGEVVPAASEAGGLVVNGMSGSLRNGKNSNSAVVCSIFKEDYGNTPIAAIEFQRTIERQAFLAGGKDFSAPIITVGDFLSDKLSREPRTVLPSYRSGSYVKLARPSEYLPDFVCNSIKTALLNFDRKIKGFASDDAVLTGAETRTSAPIRILRDNETRLLIGSDNIYPCGEGAGYAGGITSAAIDGLKTALAVIKRFKPFCE